MEYEELIRTRYSCRDFKDTRVENEKLEAVLEAGRIAPTGGNRQPQRIVVVQGAGARAKIEECTTCTYGAPIVLICCYDTEDTASNHIGDGRSCGNEDIAIVMTHMMLACHNVGLASCWIGLMYPEKLRELFNIPDSYAIVGLLDIGYAADGAVPSPMHSDRKPLEETCYYDSF